jgi:4'-phosphopantetheinyl transferase
VTDALAIEVVLVEVDPRRASPLVRMAARVAIGARLGVYPSSVSVVREVNGRPVAEGVSLSLGHAGGLGVIALADPGHAIGVDIEAVRARQHVDRIARRVFTVDELAAWSELADDARLRAFLCRWTEVEAVLKARGTGIAGGFASAVPRPAGWSCEAIDVGPGFVGTVAADVPAIAVHTRRFQRS